MILLFTDFGMGGPYVGQMKAVLHSEAPAVPVVDLFHEAPSHEPRAAAYLLAAYVGSQPPGTVVVGVVDPGVGGAREPLIVEVGGVWYVGPGNGLFELVQRRADGARQWRITWQPPRLSASFHGRDLFAPVAAMLARGEAPPGEPLEADEVRQADWPDDLPEVLYIDHFGNAVTGIRASVLDAESTLAVGDLILSRTRTFSDVPIGTAFWYENSNGLAEIAVNRGRADETLGVSPGYAITIGTRQAESA